MDGGVVTVVAAEAISPVPVEPLERLCHLAGVVDPRMVGVMKTLAD